REVGVMFVLGPPPKVLGAASNILVAVPSSTWTSMPMTGSYLLIASSYFTWLPVLPRECRAHVRRRLRGRPRAVRPPRRASGPHGPGPASATLQKDLQPVLPKSTDRGCQQGWT